MLHKLYQGRKSFKDKICWHGSRLDLPVHRLRLIFRHSRTLKKSNEKYLKVLTLVRKKRMFVTYLAGGEKTAKCVWIGTKMSKCPCMNELMSFLAPLYTQGKEPKENALKRAPHSTNPPFVSQSKPSWHISGFIERHTLQGDSVLGISENWCPGGMTTLLCLENNASICKPKGLLDSSVSWW